MPTLVDSVFYLVFAGQIYFISWYFPEKVCKRVEHVMKNYPRSQYPKLYPKSEDHYQIGLTAFRIINRITFGLGLFILFSIIFLIDHSTFADDGYISEAFPGGYGMVQILAFLLLEFSAFKQLRQMRQIDRSTLRTADLRPRRFFDFVSPRLFAIAAACFVGSFLFDLWAHDFQTGFGHDTMQRLFWMTFSNLFMGVFAAWQLYGRKQDPHQANADRIRQIGVHLNSLLYVSIAISIFFATAAADDVFDIDFLDAILMSLYFQAVVYLSIGNALRNVRLDNIDFEVYRENGAAAT